MPKALDVETLRATLDRLGVGVAAAAANGEIILSNDRFAAWFPDGAETLSARLGGFDATLAATRLRNGGSFRFETMSRGPGRSTPVTVTLLPFPEAGEAAMLAQCVDASEQRRTEYMLDSYSSLAEKRAKDLEREKKRIEALLAEISETRARLTEAVEAISEGLSLRDASGDLVLRNSRYEALFPDLSGTETDHVEASDADGSRVIQRPDGRWIRISERRTGGGGMVATYADITELKQREVELAELVRTVAEARDVAQAANRIKSSFLANMSHELRTPLNAIIGYSQILSEDARDAGDESAVADLGKIEKAGTHLLRLIDDILDLSKIEAGKVEVVVEPFDLAVLIQEVVLMIEPLAARNNNVLTVRCPSEAGWMSSDAIKLKQCLLNLLSNACKFTRDGQVKLAIMREAGLIHFSVEDTGIGIALEQQAQLFQPFQQADDTTTRQYGGTGLGLALTRSFARLLGGDAGMHSVPGEGSVFTLWLPDATLRARSDQVDG